MYKIPAKTLFLGKNLVFVPECHSTNSLAFEFSQRPSIADGTVVITDHQTAGRGQRGNSWEAEPGMNLTFSVIFKPSFLSIKDQFYLNIFSSLAVYDLLMDKTNAIVRIKWPNDVLIGNKKISGILIENQIQGQLVSNSIIGIGLNVNQREFNNESATSLKLVQQADCDLAVLLEELLTCLEARYLQLKQQKLAAMKQEYLERLHWFGEKHLFASNGNQFPGTIRGIDEIGKLRIETDSELLVFDVKEITYVS